MEYGNFNRRDGGGFRDRDNRDNRDFNRDFNRDRDFRPRDRDDRGGYDRGFDRGRGGDRFQSRGRDDRFGGGDRGGRFNDGGRDSEESVFSKRVRAGRRRTYFFDVRQTRGEDYFITITESTRREDGYGYKRHKIFLYKEDFNRFLASLNEVVEHVKTNLMPDFDYEEFDRRQAEWEAQNREGEFDDREHGGGVFEQNDDAEEETNGGDSKFRRKDDDDMAW
ncbi:MAG: DUF3276 family protein [Saprospiraceae bacterium]